MAVSMEQVKELRERTGAAAVSRHNCVHVGESERASPAA